MNMPFQTFDEQSDASQCAARLMALRIELGTRELNGFLVPRSDEHQGEYVPKRAERQGRVNQSWSRAHTSAARAVQHHDRGAPGSVRNRRCSPTRRPMRLLHRDCLIDVDRAIDLKHRAALGELNRRVKAVG